MGAVKVKENKRSVLLAVLFLALVCYFVAVLISNNAKAKALENENAAAVSVVDNAEVAVFGQSLSHGTAADVGAAAGSVSADQLNRAGGPLYFGRSLVFSSVNSLILNRSSRLFLGAAAGEHGKDHYQCE